jgi:ParB-like chromosome segregation protein Spo0J
MSTKTPPTYEVVEIPIDELRPDPANPRRISDQQLEALTRSLKEYGFVQPVLARREDRTVIGGHQRLTAARRLGYRTVPVILLDLTVEQARLLNLGLNKISGDWDQELLARLLAELAPVEAIDLSLSVSPKTSLRSSSSRSTPATGRSGWRTSTSTPRWRRPVPPHAPNTARYGLWATTACCAAMPATRAT